MNYKSHIFQTSVFLIVSLIWLFGSLSVVFSYKFILFYSIVCFATVLPDVDASESYIKKEYPLSSRVIYLAMFLVNLPIFIIYIILNKGNWRNFFQHRGFFHTIFGSISISVLTLVFLSFIDIKIGVFISSAIFFGYTMHLIEDCLTKHGVRLFWPLFDYKIRVPLVSTGTRSETIFNTIILIFAISSIILMLYSNIRDDVLLLIEKYKPSSVLLEAPDGIKPILKLISSELGKINVTVYINGSHCFGPCDIGVDIAKLFNIDLIIHIGHTGEVIGYKNFNLER